FRSKSLVPSAIRGTRGYESRRPWQLQFSWEPPHRLGSDSRRTTPRQAHTRLTASPATARTAVAEQWARAYTPRLFTRHKFNSSLTSSWLTSSLKDEEICLPSGLR